MLNPHQFTNLVLEPALKATGMYSLDAMYLMVGTAMVESKLSHLKQLPDGPALGLMQIEPATYLDIKRYLSRKNELRSKILLHCERAHMPDNFRAVMCDLALNALLARVKYWMFAEPIPSYKDPVAQGEYYKKYYNTIDGASTVEQFVKAAHECIGWVNHDAE